MRRTHPARRYAAAVLTALALAGLGAGAPVLGAAPSTLTVGLDQEPPTLDPHASPSAVTFQIIPDVTENLLYQDVSGKLLPWLATDYKASPDGKAFTFTLRRDAKFTDGAPVNAEAVKWNFDRIVNPNFKAGGALAALSGYAGSTVVDPYTIRVSFKEPYAPFLSYAGGGTLSLISPKSTPGQGDAVNQKPVGSGRFIVSEYVAKDHVTLVRNADYNRRPPYSGRQGPASVDRIVWKFIPESGTRVTTIESGETQMINFQGTPAAVLTRLSTNRAVRIEKTPYPGAPRIWVLNVRKAPTNDLKVRQALLYGVNRSAVANSVFRGLGTAACAPLTQHLLATPDLCAKYTYDPKKAAQLLDEAGWKMGPNNVRLKDGRPLSIEVNSINYGGGNLPEVELLQGQLLQLGVDAKIKSQARPPWYEDNYHCATNGPVLFLRDPDMNALAALFASTNIGGNFNWSCYANPEVDRLLAEGRAQFDPSRRRAVYARLEALLLDQAVAVPLVDELSVWVVRSSVTGTKYNYSGYPVLGDAVVGR
ncbi:MAG TPA: ABC transporter substrate-binding protein [bacterium]|nr:ABC transporter substrate-binding protein [bacterium]